MVAPLNPSAPSPSLRPAPAPAANASAPAADVGAALNGQLWTRDLEREHGFEPLAIEGTVPPELTGTLFRNGPGLFGQFGKPYSHAFEGDGAVTAMRLDGGRVYGAAKLTPSAGLLEEREAGRILYGLTAPWNRRFRNVLRGRQKNTANTSVVMWQGRLFALMEGAKPTELDPRDLAMIGETDLDGVVVSMFSAHPHRVAARKATYNFGMQYGRKTVLHMYELPDVGAARHLGAIDLPGAVMLHDFIATPTHLVFFISPARVNVPRMLLQVGSFDKLFQWKPEVGTEIICVPIDNPSEPVRFSVEAFYQWHFGNAFTRGTDELVIDYVHYRDFSSFNQIGDYSSGGEATEKPTLADGYAHRATIDLVGRRFRTERVMDQPCEFPTVAPGSEGVDAKNYAVLGSLRGVGRFDPRTGGLVAHMLPATQRVTEPLFVPRPGATRDDDGHVLALCHDGPTERAFLAIYDAARLADGPVARAWFDHHVPITFHGTWAGGVV
jgi:all-trans-8'-apo-beta-carotenal 15,15'-oxygenase